VLWHLTHSWHTSLPGGQQYGAAWGGGGGGGGGGGQRAPGVCYDFQRGQCFRQSCRFSHEAAPPQ